MNKMHLDSLNRFIISDYQQKRPFTNMLPGIAGPLGIPMWVFYVNRGQAITSFGVENKDHPIMEFQPANKAYQSTPLLGFRTFIKTITGNSQSIYEPFSGDAESAAQRMIISLNELELVEENQQHGFKVEILYFNLPEEPVAGLVRQVKISNLANRPTNLEIIDGMPAMMPYGVTNKALKETSRTLEAWVNVSNQENNFPYFQLRSTLLDTEEIRPIEAVNFSHAFVSQNGVPIPLSTIVQPEVVFGQDTALRFPANFEKNSLQELTEKSPYADGRIPCSFFAFSTMLPPLESVTLYSIYGYAKHRLALHKAALPLTTEAYFQQKRKIATEIAEGLTNPIQTKTSSPEFDAYCKQTFLDNVLRGGWPVLLGSPQKPVIYHIYSRKHGDPERDYNAFFLAPEFFSQGNGNFRDVNQNRRHEVWFNPRVKDSNIKSFMSLIQTDGYNPLVVKGSKFWMDQEKMSPLLKLVVQPDKIIPFLQNPFTPGSLLDFLDQHDIALHTSAVDFLHLALQAAEQCFDADFGEGYWTDHWTYNLDLIHSFLAIYPDGRENMLFERKDVPFFESPAFVQPRSKKYVLVGGQPRQYNAITWDTEKAALIASRQKAHKLMRSENGYGPIFFTSVFVKLTILALLKFSTMDPMGMGIEMEAGKPSWCDALNGLPGLFGSSMSETFELLLLLDFLLEQMPKNGSVELPVEVQKLMRSVTNLLQESQTSQSNDRDFLYWDAVATARETYREETRFGFNGQLVSVPFPDLSDTLTLCREKVQAGIQRAVDENGGIPPTYFTYSIKEYDILHNTNGEILKDEQQRPYLRARGFGQKTLPLFLEAPVHMLKTVKQKSAAQTIHQKIRDSDLYDPALKMYKTNVSLEKQTFEIGRLRVFTPGWLENESIFLHMEYKYLLELLKAGLCREFFEDFRHALIAFQDPVRYGRSPLENSSFLVSSAHPDKTLHGNGFVARLTGATAEFLHIWNLMMIGKNPFTIDNGELCLQLQPALPGWLFDQEGKLSFTLFGQCTVTYFNPQKKDTFAENVIPQTMHIFIGDEKIEIQGNRISSPYAELVREGSVRRIDVSFVKG